MWQAANNPFYAVTAPHKAASHAMTSTGHGSHVHDNEEMKKAMEDTVHGLQDAVAGLGVAAIAATAYGAAVNWKRDPKLRNGLVKIGSLVAIWEMMHWYG